MGGVNAVPTRLLELPMGKRDPGLDDVSVLVALDTASPWDEGLATP